jgi:fructose-bisphosphate aldolase class 1
MEPKVLIKSPTKAEAETILRDELLKGLDALGGDDKVVIKLTIPEVAGPLETDDRPPPNGPDRRPVRRLRAP